MRQCAYAPSLGSLDIRKSSYEISYMDPESPGNGQGPSGGFVDGVSGAIDTMCSMPCRNIFA